ncbi:MAG: hypothetical protein N2037_10325 [Acidimicrobiales bacterium]|nr:hypothetical protein [Acidimicrobiales bacterium]
MNSVALDGIDLSPPRTVEALGIPAAMVHDLVLRQALRDGRTSTVALSEKIGISPNVMQTVVEELRELRYLEVQGLEGRDYLLAPTEAGRAQAADRMALCRYTGKAPVSLESYTAVVRAQRAEPKMNLAALREAFSDLVISDDLLREIGPAAMARGAMFLYGPPGTGKSSIAERLLRVYPDHVLVPYAVEVDGQIITVFDPVIHRPAEEQPRDIDARWVLCRRPFIIVGGELTASMLDLAYQSNSGIYLAPIQMQANNGILVIDDFGRQTMTPQELLNRWIVPLDRQIDYLTLDYGMKFEVPFDVKIVFSTNLEPKTLGDEAFFRRIQSKILVPTISDEQFEEVLRRVAAANGIELTPDAPTHLRWMSRELGDGDLRPYLPGAVCEILKSICAFEDAPLRLDPAMITRIAHMYFTHAQEPIEAKEEEPPRSIIEELVSAEAPAGPPGGSIFSFGSNQHSNPSKSAASTTRDWTAVAAKAMAALKEDTASSTADGNEAAVGAVGDDGGPGGLSVAASVDDGRGDESS